MSAVVQIRDHYRAEFERAEAALGGAPWVQALRRSAFDCFNAQGFPGPRDEEWKYTRTAAIAQRRYAMLDGALQRPSPVDQAGSFSPRLVFIDGHYHAGLSQRDSLPAGAVVADLATVLSEPPQWLRDHLGSVAVCAQHPYTALNTAFLHEGACIYLPSETLLKRPVHLVFRSTSAQAGRIMQPHVMLVLEAGSRATVVEHYQGPDGVDYFTNTVTEVVLGPHAELDHYRVQEEGLKASHISGVHVRQAEHSRFSSCSVALGGALVRNEIDVALAGTEAECYLYGLYLAGGRQHVDHHTRMDHLVAHGRSRQLYKGVLDGHGRGVFDGRVVVHPGADKSDARQSNHNLLLSTSAEADSKPQLEIYADDVKCSHGATVGQLDQDALFYLRARGIAETTARALLIYAFCGELLAQMKVAELSAWIKKALLARLPQADLSGDLL